MTTVASETWTGSNGAAWASQWTSSGNGSSTSAIQGNKGRQTTGAGAYQYRADRLNVVLPTDFEATLNVTPTVGSERYGLISFRGGATNVAKLNSSYQLRIIAGNVEVYKVNASGTETWFASATLSWVSTDILRFRIFCSGSTIRVRFWKNGDSEPGTWNLDMTDSTYTGTGLQLSCFNGNEAVADTWDWDDLVVDDFAGGSSATVTPTVVAAVAAVPAVTVAGGTSAARRIHTAFSWTASPPALPAANTQLQKVPLHNVHMVGYGSGNPNPSPGTFNWTSLDAQVQRMRDASGPTGTKMITFASAPGWMKTTSTNPATWATLEGPDGAVVPSHFTDFANLCVAVVQRYPDVTWFNVWNGMKGFWNATLNRYDYEGYVQMYNTVYNAVKSARPGAKIGGPYMTFLTSDGAAAADDPPDAIRAGRALTYNEDFNGASTPSGWYANDWVSNRNNEQQRWSPLNVTYSASKVILRMETAAQHNARVGFTNNLGKPYVCGMLESSLQFGKGLFAFKCKLAKIPHTWQGPWMYDLTGGRLEIDVCEDPNLTPGYATNYHYVGGQAGPIGVTHDVTQWTVYAVDWQDNAIIFYKNWVETNRFTGAIVQQAIGHNMMMLLQTAVGGNWPGNADASTDALLPANAMEVDWVRAWQGSGSGTTTFVPSTVTFTGGVFDQRDLDALTYWKNNAVGFDHVTVAGSLENRWGAEFSSTAANQLGKFLVMDQWLRANIHASKPIVWAETYLHKGKTVGGLTQAQLEDLWFTMLGQAEAGVQGEVWHSTWGEFPNPIVYEPQPANVDGSTNRFNTLVTNWEGTASQSASVATQTVAAVASVPAAVVPVPATVVASVVAARAGVPAPAVVTPGSTVVQATVVASIATVPTSTVSATSTGVNATVTPATVEARAGSLEIEIKARRSGVQERRAVRFLRWWMRRDGGLWP